MSKNQEKIKAALESIENSLEAINTNEDWLKYLSFQSLFYNYSFRNAILIFLQNPEASYVKGYKAWNKLGRYVKKGSTGISILAPCFRKVEENIEEKQGNRNKDEKDEIKKVISGFKFAYVYDIADTDGSDEYLPVLVKGLKGNGEYEREIYEKLKEFISKEHMVKEVTGISAKGSYNVETGVICIRADLEYAQKIKTLIHEHAHAVDFTLHPEPDISRNRRELVAESVAYVVCQRFGIDTGSYSMSYLKSWLKDTNELKIIADTVQKVSARIIHNLAESTDFAFLFLKEDEE